MASTYKITYFNARGVSEPIRYILSYAGQEFKDVRYELDQWPAAKPTTPFGKLPTVEIDGKLVHQSLAICRHLARKFDLVGDGKWDALQADIVVDTLGDMKTASIEYFRLAVYNPGPVDQERVKQLKEILLKETLPFYFAKFEEIVKNNKGYFVNGKNLVKDRVMLQLTWADFVWTANMETFCSLFGKEILDDYPSLRDVMDKVHALPAIKTWMDKRPVTRM